MSSQRLKPAHRRLSAGPVRTMSSLRPRFGTLLVSAYGLVACRAPSGQLAVGPGRPLARLSQV
ncbi:hypothetical protein SBA4_7510002 [Candidatus Sulfopaludibacter sp. SbA4]|nr:hypothetical protein SBA4_7510002 [Candidatus Sulfopaludibacter sp. SbA4]